MAWCWRKRRFVPAAIANPKTFGVFAVSPFWFPLVLRRRWPPKALLRPVQVGGKIGPQQISGEDISPTVMLARAAGGFLLSTGRCSAQEGWKRGLLSRFFRLAGFRVRPLSKLLVKS